jgi:exosortase
MSGEEVRPSTDSRGPRWPLGVAAILVAGMVWSEWDVLSKMAQRWMNDARYSHGILVPIFSAYLLWTRRDRLRDIRVGAHGAGLILIALGSAIAMAGAIFFVEWLRLISVLFWLGGLVFLVGGRPAWRWCWPSVLFLFFMIPLPYQLENALGGPLQRIATKASTFALQMMGLPAVAEGNVILMNEARIGVVEACKGLGMLFMFLAFSAAVAILIDRPLIDKILILLGAIPTAVAANVLRITVTGLLHETVGGKFADYVYHDLAGWLMMPIALGFLGLQLWILSKLFVEVATPASGWVGVPVVSHPSGERRPPDPRRPGRIKPPDR